MTVDQKIQKFIRELNGVSLDDTQAKIYYMFVRNGGHPVNISVNDKNGETVRFRIYGGKDGEGSEHILKRHYCNSRGEVSALEIINLCEVIRKGEKHRQLGCDVYEYRKHNRSAKLTTVLKVLVDDRKVLKSFYSDRGI